MENETKYTEEQIKYAFIEWNKKLLESPSLFTEEEMNKDNLIEYSERQTNDLLDFIEKTRCMKSDEVCKFDCSGLCKESC